MKRLECDCEDGGPCSRIAVCKAQAVMDSRIAELERDLAAAGEDARIGKVVWRFIDRMNDVCEQDPAEKILAEFIAAMNPVIDAARKEQP